MQQLQFSEAIHMALWVAREEQERQLKQVSKFQDCLQHKDKVTVEEFLRHMVLLAVDRTSTLKTTCNSQENEEKERAQQTCQLE